MSDELSVLIAHEVRSWPGVATGDTGRDGLRFSYGRVELGHLHGESVAHLPFPRKIRDGLIARGRASAHPPPPESGWVECRMDDSDGAEAVIKLLRMNYERAKARDESRANAPS